MFELSNKIEEQEIEFRNTVIFKAPYYMGGAYICLWDEDDNPMSVYGPFQLGIGHDVTMTHLQNCKELSLVKG